MDILTTVVTAAVQVLAVGVDLAALGVALARLQRHPVVSMLVAVSMGAALLTRAAWFILPRAMDLSGGHEAYLLASAGLSVIGTVGVALLVAAAFIERPDANGPPTQRW